MNFLHQGWRFTPLRDVPIAVERSCVPVLVVFALAFSRVTTVTGLWLGVRDGLLVALLLIFSSILHALGRAFAGRMYGMAIQSIQVQGLGATTTLQGNYQRPLQMVEIAIAGSLLNLAIFVGLSSLAFVRINLGDWVLTLVESLKTINVTMGLFYLIPGVPMDGTRVMRAWLWSRSGKLAPPTPWMAQIGYLASAIALAVGLYAFSQHTVVGVVLLYLGLWACLTHPDTVLPQWNFTSRGRTSPRASQSAAIQPTAKANPKVRPSLPSLPTVAAPFLWCSQPEERFVQAMHYVDHDKFQAAIALFSQVIQANPEGAEAFHNRGNAYLRVGDATLALEDFKTALRLGLHQFEPYLGQGNAYLDGGDYLGAIMAYSEALRLSPEASHVYQNRAKAYAALGDHQRAIADYRRAEHPTTEPSEASTPEISTPEISE